MPHGAVLSTSPRGPTASPTVWLSERAADHRTTGRGCPSQGNHSAGESNDTIEQGDEPVEALQLKMPYHCFGFMNLRFAGDPDCSTDMRA
jgi:hypothetical protein